MTERGPTPINLLRAKRLARLLRPLRGNLARRPRSRVYAEEEVRDRIYGWHSGTVEPPEPMKGVRTQR